MRQKRKEFPVYEKVFITDAGAEGKAVARIGDQVIFIPFAVPGDIVDVRVTKQRKQYLEGRVLKIHTKSDKRIDPICSHFGTCGGCRWQNMKYEEQLFYKQKQVDDHLKRIGKFTDFELLPILSSNQTTFYRNKLEYTFSNRRWFTKDEMIPDEKDKEEPGRRNALGFHIPGMFDKVLDIQTCYLQQEPSNSIRLALKAYALENGISFYDVMTWTGFLRNVIIRTSMAGEIMVILVVRENKKEIILAILDHLLNLFPAITSLYYVVNQKKNDSLYDQEFVLYKGEPVIMERMQAFEEGDPDLSFRVGPSSFFQTNSEQAARLYHIAAEFADLRGDELVYDLYTGTGTIACYIARYVKEVIGIDTVEPAIRDAELNAKANEITNTRFFDGEVEKILNASFFKKHGKPDLIITDPPRSGMHEKSIIAILEALPEKIVYISCNSATQARDMQLLQDQYILVKCQPVDMFPHTHHVENIALLKRKKV
ncbi:MAG: 23S rRNA (uracil(1939)-C(5))-methyltransferase RlmD [Bacteroidales bacterium]|nr:23S rRNA (uracil(1939)-C(5))-methyltransferase RlmD [Bacteroidales bacterium]